MPDPQSPPVAPDQDRRASVLKAASLLTAANAVAILSGIVTGPLVARSLGPEGRGLLAAIVAPLALAAQLGQLSMGESATRATALGARPGAVFGSLLPILLVSGSLSAGIVIALSGPLAAGASTVEHYLVVGAILLPLGLLVPLSVGIASGRHRWGIAAVSQALGPLAYTVTICALFATGTLSVDHAAIATISTGLVGLVVFLPAALRGRRRIAFDREVARGGLSYGGRALPGVVAVFSNGRLDQILMLSLAGSEQLGLYAVAVTYAAMTTSLVASLGVAISPSVAAGDHALIARTCRLTLAATLVCVALAAIASYPVFFLLFGPSFAAAEGMGLILLVAQVPAAASLVLGLGLRSMGRPGTVSLIDLLGLAVTVPALLLVLPGLGGVGAALVSLSAYAIVFAALLRAVARHTGIPAREFVAVRRSDLVESVIRLRGVAARVAGRLRRRTA